MKRKILLVIMVMALSSSMCFATQEQIYNPLEPVIPAYVAVSSVSSVTTIKSGTATYYAELASQPGKTITKVVSTLKLVNSKGTVVQTKTETLTPNYGYFRIQNTKKLTTRGAYHAEASLKVYNGTKLLETVTISSKSATY